MKRFRWRLILTAVISLFLGGSGAAEQGPSTIRRAVMQLRFEEAMTAPDAPDLDAGLTSSEFAASKDTFVAAYYFQRELSGECLAPGEAMPWHRDPSSSHGCPAWRYS
jgi:hypothetical protein